MSGESNTSTSIGPLNQTWRIVVFFINVAIAWGVFYLSTGASVPTASGNSIWFLSIVAYWLLRLITAPFFSPPKESIGIAVATILLLAPLDFSHLESNQTLFIRLNEWSMVFAILVGALGILAVLKRANSASRVGRISYETSKVLGRGELLFTLAIVISVLGYYPSALGWGGVILAVWTAEVSTHPIELIARLGIYLFSQKTASASPESAGTLLRVDAPNIVRVALVPNYSNWIRKAIHLVHLPNGQKEYVVPLFAQIQDREIVGTGLCCTIDEEPTSMDIGAGNVCKIEKDGLHTTLSTALSGQADVQDIIGIVVEGSCIGTIKFQVLPDSCLEEGMVLFANIRDKRIYYQILEANTKEEDFSSNPLGIHIATAAQIGYRDAAHSFRSFPWLPEMNQPLFLAKELAPEKGPAEGDFFIGRVPSTEFPVAASVKDLVEFHTAVLGMTGKGKTELALEIIRNALAQGTKVLCVDFTGEYKIRLKENNPEVLGLEIEAGTKFADKLFEVETGAYGAGEEKKALQDFLNVLGPKINEQIADFLTADDRSLGIFELSELTNTKATLRTTELYLSSIMSWARAHRKLKRILIVLEEAHTVIPEAVGSGMDRDTQWVVGRIGQIALQGRKYGVGLLLVSQRTALVSKTILSQCNTYFTHALVDRTSLDYLAGVYSQDHVKAIPNLKFLECVAFGKGVRSERPIIIRRDFDDEIEKACKELDSVREAEETTSEQESGSQESGSGLA